MVKYNEQHMMYSNLGEITNSKNPFFAYFLLLSISVFIGPVAHAATLPVTINFNSGGVNNWQVIDDSQAGSKNISNWRVMNGTYQQRNNVSKRGVNDTPFFKSFNRGSYSFLSGFTNLKNYQFSVDITPLPDSGKVSVRDAKEVGVMFRYQNNNNYYRLSFSGYRGQARLEKKIAGKFVSLKTISRGYIDGKLIKVRIGMQGKIIQVHVNGESLFAVHDASISRGSIALYSQDKAHFDNVSIKANSTSPSIVIANPLAHSVQTKSLVKVTATVMNMPVAGKVLFSLSGVPCAASKKTQLGVYTSNCGKAIRGDYIVTARVKDRFNMPVTSDTKHQVGVGGDVYIAIGDSITAGTNDNYKADNISKNGRYIGMQGYEALLMDKLSVTVPQSLIIFNEGVGGDKASNGKIRLPSILKRHVNANKATVMYGTNDSGGKDPVQTRVFLQNLTDMVKQLKARRITAWVARIPPVFNRNGLPNVAQNRRIQNFNTAILTQLNDAYVNLGPDFYDYFLGAGQNRSSLFDNDGVHPNGLGYRAMAQLWHNAIVGGGPQPFVLEDIYPLSIKQNFLEKGNKYYANDKFTLKTIPEVLKGGIWLMTSNSIADQKNSRQNYLSFSLDRIITLFVAYDSGAKKIPQWLNSFTKTNLSISVSNPATPKMRLYRKTINSDRVSLGGNNAYGKANYVVIIK